MAQNVQKTSENPIDEVNDIDYYWNLKEDLGAKSQFKTVNFRSEESTSSIGSVSSSELLDDDDDDDDDDASSNLSPRTHLLHEFSESTTKTQPCTKKGLSRYYEGKAKTFSSFSDVKCVQDLVKKQIPIVKRGHRSRIKTCLQSPKTIIISKKNTRRESASFPTVHIFQRN